MWLSFLLYFKNTFASSPFNWMVLQIMMNFYSWRYYYGIHFELLQKTCWKSYSTSDGHKFINSKLSEKYIQIKCGNFRNVCRCIGRLNHETDLVTPLSQHNNDIDEYRSDVIDLRTKCKKTAMHSQTNLRHVFEDKTGGDPSACEITFVLYRARRQLQQKVKILWNFAKCYLQLA